ncbi:MAG: aminopeptidase [Lachnospiraceae bacterium]|nr:aminopeptidase [Agathobacter sp.]MDD6445014.1 aminopeptidase [Lachnospiraceae bacterium]MDY4892493.1 aminopeptidase [Agathobacter sp.]
MSYKEINIKRNEEYWERLDLVMERIREIEEEEAADVNARYRNWFIEISDKLQVLYKLLEASLAGKLEQISEADGERMNRRLFLDIHEDYEVSYGNPAFAVERLGAEYGQLLCALDAKIHSIYPFCMEGDIRYLCIYSELFVEIYNCFEEEEDLTEEEIRQIIYSFMHDYSEIFNEDAILRLIHPEYDYAGHIVMDSDLADLSYLYRYGLYVGKDEKESARYFATLPQEKIQAMADTFTEGYRIGFQTTGKDISLKSVAEIRYPVGFERMVQAAVRNFEKIGLQSVLKPYSISLNKQYTYDHKEDRALWLDKALVERGLEVNRTVWEKQKEAAPKYGGPAVIDIFGTPPFSPVQKKERVVCSDHQRELEVYERSEKSQLINRYIHGDERSFTIIAYPVPSIGEKYKEIFAETVRINTLDYELYRDMQQKLIDVLDTADRVHIKGANGNHTDLYVKIHPLSDPEKETAFENCVADVNIPVGEVFTTPVLDGTEGVLHVTQVYLEGFLFKNLELKFEEGQIVSYSCTNFDSEEENRKYIEDNILFHHKTLPMGEFAIGTNTTAYRMARTYDIADKMPILIAEKTGPHFAVGDTCYSYDEDHMTCNPDGKAIIARDNEISLLRKSDISKAYFNCHTDITISYDELGAITVIRADGSTEDIIKDGLFVVPGTEPLNEPLLEK